MVPDHKELQKQIAVLTPGGQILFALLCAERLRASCWAFSKRENWDITSYYEGCDFLFEQVVQNTTIDQTQVESYVDDLDKCVPQSDEFGDPLAVQAQSGLIALLHAFDSVKTADSEAGVNAAGAVEEGVDNYQYFVNKEMTGQLTSPTEYPLLDREIKWQLESIATLRQFTRPEREKYVSLRILNRTYAVPIAV